MAISIEFGFVKASYTDDPYYCTEVLLISHDRRSYKVLHAADNTDASKYGRYGSSWQIAKAVAADEAAFLGVNANFCPDMAELTKNLTPMRA